MPGEEEILTADKKAPRKQRHNARRIWQRIRNERGSAVAESTVRAYVGERRRDLGLGQRVFVPQHHQIGAQAEADFYEVDFEFPCGRQTAQVILPRSEYSAAARHVAYATQTNAGFPEGLELGQFLGGVPAVIRFDNLVFALKRVIRGIRRVKQDRFIAFRSHYLFEASFTTPGIEGGHEKGGVEGENGRCRRQWTFWGSEPIEACPLAARA